MSEHHDGVDPKAKNPLAVAPDNEKSAADSKVHFGPGQSDDGRPKCVDLDFPVMKEMLERRSTEVLERSFGHVEGFAKALKSDLERGVDSSTVQARLDQFGENLLSKKDPVTFFEFLAEAYQDQIVIILCVAAVISIIFGMTLPNPHSGHVERETGWIEGTALIISVQIVTLVGSINNYQKAKKFEEMEKEQAIRELQVIRDGREVTILSNELVVGDLLVLETGMELQCDGLYVRGSDIKISEAALTGEPDLIEKSRDEAIFISGTAVEEGNGVILVIATGMGTFQGGLKATLEDDDDDDGTPLQQHLGELADDIGKFGLAGATILLVALSIKEGILIGQGERTANAASFLNFFLIAITLIAVAIPEGLPLAVTISLAFSMQAMMKDNCMVRILASCETMGAATAICSDKTGTLTQNKMTVVQACLAECEFVIDGYGITPRFDAEVVSRSGDGDEAEIARPARMMPEIVEKACYALAVNSSARENVIDGQMVWVGNKTEHGLLKWVKAMKCDYVAMREEAAGESKDCVRQYPFSSAKKRMTTLVKDLKSGVVAAYFKGASESVLASADRYLAADGSVQEMTDERRAYYDEVIMDMAQQGNRTIGVAMTELAGVTEFPDDEPADAKTVFVGVFGIQDPLRLAVPQAVLDSESAGLTIRMVTGDNIHTAKAIAKKCHIFKEDGFDYALTGEEFRQMLETDKDTLVELLPRLKILARSSPTDKHILVGLLQDELGEVVGVTGDGTNDAPALKLADVGFAMNTGTDIARDASDMVLIDDNFATVVTAIMWGRAVNDNIKKFLQFQLAINCSGVMLTIIGSLASETSKEPFTPVQLLWLNLIMDTLAAIALATEIPEAACLQRPPVFKQAPLITNRMRGFIAVHAIFQIILILLVLFLGHKWFDTIENEDECKDVVGARRYAVVGNQTVETSQARSCREACEHEGGVYDGDTAQCQQGLVHSTIIFNVYIWFQIFNVINARKIYGEMNPLEGVITRSQNLLIVFGIILLLQVVAVELFGSFMATTGLRWDYWLICVGLGACELIVGVFQRLMPLKDHVPDFVERKAARLAELRAKQRIRTSHGETLQFAARASTQTNLAGAGLSPTHSDISVDCRSHIELRIQHHAPNMCHIVSLNAGGMYETPRWRGSYV
eukprot:CAMPEP_0174842054 /NCGR_PEP_ID=MMETSP1114-20130205/9679_1 /TAXON_ID=312471 /ORGANISM="Neobodo designis, Strain CCAP 1951/1" /LENGTH=1145 /DNA_ID=CAMNT_0016076251 /DNA_START=59 /DNA_END=3497 /DNA_ORIENTATION=+